jgi:hypothetical protein
MAGGAMLRLVFESETVKLLLLNAPGRCRAGEKITSAVQGWTNSSNAENYGCRVYLLLTETSLFNLL